MNDSLSSTFALGLLYEKIRQNERGGEREGREEGERKEERKHREKWKENLKNKKPISEVEPMMVRIKNSKYSEMPFDRRIPAKRLPRI